MPTSGILSSSIPPTLHLSCPLLSSPRTVVPLLSTIHGISTNSPPRAPRSPCPTPHTPATIDQSRAKLAHKIHPARSSCGPTALSLRSIAVASHAPRHRFTTLPLLPETGQLHTRLPSHHTNHRRPPPPHQCSKPKRPRTAQSHAQRLRKFHPSLIMEMFHHHATARPPSAHRLVHGTDQGALEQIDTAGSRGWRHPTEPQLVHAIPPPTQTRRPCPAPTRNAASKFQSLRGQWSVCCAAAIAGRALRPREASIEMHARVAKPLSQGCWPSPANPTRPLPPSPTGIGTDTRLDC
uniref:Uncharacterized protein n=1 Tax=Physcomitrium patens TaxID=3218 RepID=A0A7I4CQR2_PHYPA